MTDLLTAQQVADMTGKSVRAVQAAASEGRLAVALKLPGLTGAFLFRETDVYRWIDGTKAGRP